MAILRERPYGNFNFHVEIAGTEVAFEEVVLPEAWLAVIEYRNGNEKENGVRKIPGREHYGNLVLRRGAIGSLNLYQWWNDVRNGNTNAFRTVTVQLQSEDHTAVVMTWKLLRAWPVRFKFSALDGKGDQPLLEVLELAFERLEME